MNSNKASTYPQNPPSNDPRSDKYFQSSKYGDYNARNGDMSSSKRRDDMYHSERDNSYQQPSGNSYHEGKYDEPRASNYDDGYRPSEPSQPLKYASDPRQ